MKIPGMKVPDWFEQADSLPDDPPYSRAYCYRSSGAGCFALVCPIPAQSAMPYGDPRSVIDGIHQAMGDDQGLIGVEAGISRGGRRWICSIVKTLQRTGGVQYCLTLHMEYPGCAVQVQGFFDETGTTGLRDAAVYVLLSRNGDVKTTENGLEGWSADPYDPWYTRGVRMNCSERREFDEQFPQHPLSEARRFLQELVSLN